MVKLSLGREEEEEAREGWEPVRITPSINFITPCKRGGEGGREGGREGRV